MKNRGNKIRRYGNIYGRGPGSGSWQIVVAMVAGVLLFGVIGWSLYAPVQNWIAQLDSGREAASRQEISIAPPVSQDPPQPSPQDPAVPEGSAQRPAMEGIYLPASLLGDETLVSGFLQRASAASLNTVVVEAKDAAGTVLYRSDNALARSAGASDPSAYDAGAIAAAIREAGFVPAARLHAFRDSLAPAYAREAAVRYYDTESLWYDNDPALGGKAWLNPCSQEAQDYILSLAGELVDNGFEVLLLDSVQFPSGVALEKAGYGVENPDRAQVLADFIARVRRTVEEKGATLVVCLPADALLTGEEEADAAIAEANRMIYGGNPAPALEGPVLLTLSNDPEVSRTLLGRAGEQNPRAQWLGLLPAYRNDGSLLDCKALLSSVDPDGYLLYNPAGNYQL